MDHRGSQVRFDKYVCNAAMVDVSDPCTIFCNILGQRRLNAKHLSKTVGINMSRMGSNEVEESYSTM